MPLLHEVAVIGGGRWTRVLTATLSRLLSPSTRISLHSAHCADSLRAWLKSTGLGGRIEVSSEWPLLERPDSSAVIISNAARDHERAARFALCSGAPVLVEKPLALSLAGGRELANMGCRSNGRLAAANVFLFAGYIDRFAHLLASKKEKLQSLKVCWVDPAFESRYGEAKTFDAGLPVFADVLPHVSSILGVFIPKAPQACQELQLLRGGARVELQLTVDGIPCHVSLARNGSRRERRIDVVLDRTRVFLDFTEEPGTIVEAGVLGSADPDWATRSRPLELMLHAFLQWVTSDKFDTRISVEPALRACALIDQVSDLYNSALTSWLRTRLAIPGDDEQLRYALNEVLQSEGPLKPAVLEREREDLLRTYARTANLDSVARLVTSTDRRAVLTRWSSSKT